MVASMFLTDPGLHRFQMLVDIKIAYGNLGKKTIVQNLKVNPLPIYFRHLFRGRLGA